MTVDDLLNIDLSRAEFRWLADKDGGIIGTALDVDGITIEVIRGYRDELLLRCEDLMLKFDLDNPIKDQKLWMVVHDILTWNRAGVDNDLANRRKTA